MPIIHDSPTLVDVTAAIAAADLPDARKSTLTNAIATVCRWLGKAPYQIPADRTFTTPLLKNLVRSPARTGVSRQRVKNVKCEFEQALDVLIPRDRLPKLGRDGTGLAPEWLALWRAWRPLVPKAYGPLSTLMRWCTVRGIPPEAVDNSVAEAVADWMVHNGRRADRPMVLRQIRGFWNQAVHLVPGWPQRPITAALKPTVRVCLPEADFPPRFIASIDAFCAAARAGSAGAAPTMLDEYDASDALEFERREQRCAILGEESTAAMRSVILATATALVRRERASIAALSCVEDVITPIGFACLYDSIVARHPRDPATGQFRNATNRLIETQTGHLMMAALRLPRHCDHVVSQLHQLRRRVHKRHRVCSDMTAKNQQRLAQFDNPRVLKALHEMPITVFRQLETERTANIAAGRVPVSARMALRALTAVAVLLLNTLPVRLKTLCLTELDRNIIWPARRQDTGLLCYEAWQTKTDVAMQAPLAPWKVRLLEIYRDVYRPALADITDNPYLLASSNSEDGRRGRMDSFGELIARHVRRETGVEINPHLWRHLSKKVMLAADARYADAASVLLGHVEGRREYGGIASEMAAQALERAVVASTSRARGSARPGARRTS
ncbi:MAG TPA: hypothetical protein VD995_05110 [Azospirillum sp.]|nr:hypothetical protein [Azospirillum sp.]